MYEDNNIEESSSFITGIWSEKVLVITKDYQIKGKVFMPKTGRKNRVLSDILNGAKRFVAIKDCEVIHREFPNRKAESHDFLQLNLNSIILLRPTPVSYPFNIINFVPASFAYSDFFLSFSCVLLNFSLEYLVLDSFWRICISSPQYSNAIGTLKSSLLYISTENVFC